MATIEQIFEAAHAANLVHFPNAIHIVRNCGSWEATITKDGSTPVSGVSPHGRGKTADEAVQSIVSRLHDSLIAQTDDAERERSEKRAAIAKLIGESA